MIKHNKFNFERDIQNLLNDIILSPSQYEKCPIKQQISKSDYPKEQFAIISQQIARKSKRQRYATQIETKECLLYAFCSQDKNQSILFIQMIQKRSIKKIEIPLKRISLEVSCLHFAYDQFQQITLVVGTKCGKMLIYKHFEGKQLTVNLVHISANEITFILTPSFRNYLFVLNKIGTIYLFNYLEGRVANQFRCSMPLIEDPNPRLIMDLSETLLGHVCSYGRIIIWEITQQIKKSLYSQKAQVKEIHQNKSNKHFKYILRYKMSISNSFVTGIQWADFIGIFIAFINFKGQLRILAININQFYQIQQFFTVISQYAICRDRSIGKSGQKESIADAIRLKGSKGIIIGKNIELFNNSGKVIQRSCLIEKYTLDKEFKICKILTVNLPKINIMKQMLLSDQQQYVLIRNQAEYCLIKVRVQYQMVDL